MVNVSRPRPVPASSSTGPSRVVDVVIVGAGIIGLAHAALALANGLTVVLLERDHRAVGASVRNFGHCCITAQSGELYDLAQVSRKHWLEYAARAGFSAIESGAVVLARTESELAVLRELSALRGPGQVELLTAAETRARLGSASSAASAGGRYGVGAWPGLLGGAFLRDDLRVDPRTTVDRLAAWLGAQPGVQLFWNTAALGFGQDAAGAATVSTSRGEFSARQVFVCVGHDVDYLFPDVAADHQIQRCSLQMSLAAGPAGVQIAPAVLTATSMLRYPAFTELPAAAALRAEVERTRPELLEIGANVMFTQRPDGGLILGDSHHYGSAPGPFLSESVTETINAEIEAVIGQPLDIVERWQGVYASSDVAPILVCDVLPGVTVVSVTSGVGMTLSFGLAQRNLAHFC
ncbi:TIGR03364 family FAD-dependent oxidoreductase [Pseudarthrobacter sp. B907]